MKFLFLVVSLFLFLGLEGYAQSRNRAEKEAKLSTSIKEGNYQPILDAGSSGDRSLIPFLRSIADESKPWVQMALAKLGEKEFFDQILTEVDSEDPNVQDRGMVKLQYIGGHRGFRTLYRLLDDESSRRNPSCESTKDGGTENATDSRGGECDVVFFPRSAVSMQLLSKMLPPPPLLSKSMDLKQRSRIWKEWLVTNNHITGVIQ